MAHKTIERYVIKGTITKTVKNYSKKWKRVIHWDLGKETKIRGRTARKYGFLLINKN